MCYKWRSKLFHVVSINCTEHFTFRCSVRWLCAQKDLAPRFVWICPEREFWLGWSLSASVWHSALFLSTATEPPCSQSPLQPRVGRAHRGSSISSVVKFPLPLPPGVEGTPAAKVKEFRSFTQENLKAPLNSKQGVKLSFSFWKDLFIWS